jgi:lipopolysaccharide/colanic/teichoic acid biosynthesis glycosyltransferase
LLAWLNDRGPVFFQTRIGKNGRPFELAKLRTMRADPGGRRSLHQGQRPADHPRWARAARRASR